jgi:hypothetical protein
VAEGGFHRNPARDSEKEGATASSSVQTRDQVMSEDYPARQYESYLAGAIFSINFFNFILLDIKLNSIKCCIILYNIVVQNL